MIFRWFIPSTTENMIAMLWLLAVLFTFCVNLLFSSRIQRGDSRIQEHFVYRLGRRRTRQNPTPLETLLPKHARTYFRRRLLRQRTNPRKPRRTPQNGEPRVRKRNPTKNSPIPGFEKKWDRCFCNPSSHRSKNVRLTDDSANIDLFRVKFGR